MKGFKFHKLKLLALMAVLLLAALLFVIINDKTVNSSKLGPTPTVLISIDGFRHDYLTKYQPSQLIEIAKKGLTVEHFLPIYPSKSFPNHLSIITGSYSARHGIVHNRFYSKDKDKVYDKGAAAKDPSWITALPLWTLAEQQGLRSAVVFWPEAQARVAQVLPQDAIGWQRGVSDQQIINKIISFANRSRDTRPDLIVGYLSSIDFVGHTFGPDAPQMASAINQLNRGIGRLTQALAKLDHRVNLIIVSDHGMSDVSNAKALQWQKLIAPNNDLKVINGITQLMISARHGTEATAQLYRLRRQLVDRADGRYRVLTDDDLRKLSHKGANSADIICEAVMPYLFSDTQRLRPGRGNHGWDVNNNPDMAGFMVASGPSFKPNQYLDKAENIHLYPLLAHILGLRINHQIDGQLATLRPYLVENDG